jgi:hypothetical protein
MDFSKSLHNLENQKSDFETNSALFQMVEEMRLKDQADLDKEIALTKEDILGSYDIDNRSSEEGSSNSLFRAPVSRELDSEEEADMIFELENLLSDFNTK